MHSLVKKAQHGNAEAFIQLMEDNKQTMMRIAYGFFKNEQDVADVMQETTLNAYEHIKDLKKEEFFRTWLIRILINNCNRLFNRSQKECGLDDYSESVEGSYNASDTDFFELLHLLPEKSRLIFQLFYGEQFTTKEISKLLQINESTVKSKLHRGKEVLRSELRAI